MEKRKVAFIISIVAMVLCALVAIAGIIVFYAGATAILTLPIALISSGAGGVLISIIVMFSVIPKNNEDK